MRRLNTNKLHECSLQTCFVALNSFVPSVRSSQKSTVLLWLCGVSSGIRMGELPLQLFMAGSMPTALTAQHNQCDNVTMYSHPSTWHTAL